MAVRNFWLDAKVDGRKTDLDGGPRGRFDGFRQRIYIRDEGSIQEAFYIEGRYVNDGDLEIVVRKSETGEELRVRTRR